MNSWADRLIAAFVMFALVIFSIFVVFAFGDEVVLSSQMTTAYAVLTLLASIPLVDLALSSGRVRPEVAGIVMGFPLGLLVFQATNIPDLMFGAVNIISAYSMFWIFYSAWRILKYLISRTKSKKI